ncbi:proteasome-interacting protein cic1 [Lecanora helva]
MAPDSAALTTKAENGSPYQLDVKQTAKASAALLKHIAVKSSQERNDSTTRNLFESDIVSSDSSLSDAVPIWLILTSKKFITDQRKLKPRKIALPYSLNDSPNTSICLITPEPQRLFKDTIAHPSFPPDLSKRITKVISVQKLEKKYHSFESKRQLRDSFDIFLADDRIITYLAKILGKIFYKITTKRPIPVRLEVPNSKPKKNVALPSTKLRKESSDSKTIVSTPQFAKEIERTLSTAQLHLTPSTTTAVKVGLASFAPEQLAANVEAVMAGLTGKLIAWRNVKSVHIKGPHTMALPIWLAQELWADEGMILEDDEVEERNLKRIENGKKKRKTIDAPLEATAEIPAQEKKRKDADGEENKGESSRKKAKKLQDEDFSREMKERRQKLREQKKEARAKIEQKEGGDLPKPASAKKEKVTKG